jgi:hypothetical protein
LDSLSPMEAKYTTCAKTQTVKICVALRIMGQSKGCMNKLTSAKRAEILGMMVEGMSLRAIARLTGASKNRYYGANATGPKGPDRPYSGWPDVRAGWWVDSPAGAGVESWVCALFSGLWAVLSLPPSCLHGASQSSSWTNWAERTL